jgi:hypothetical protein
MAQIFFMMPSFYKGGTIRFPDYSKFLTLIWKFVLEENQKMLFRHIVGENNICFSKLMLKYY